MKIIITTLCFIAIAFLCIVYSYAYIEDFHNNSLQIEEVAIDSTKDMEEIPLKDTLTDKIDLSYEKKGAFFDTDGKLFYYDSLKENIIEIAPSGYPKYNAKVSPNGKYILYNHSLFDTYKDFGKGLMVGVCDFEGNIIHSITVNTKHSNDILHTEWINDSYFAITCHVNPSTSEYFVYSIDSGEEISYYNGYSFSVIDNADVPIIMHAVNVPHGFGDKAYHSYSMNGEVVYTSKNMGATLSNVSVSKDKTKIAFVESFIYDENKLPFLVVMKAEHGKLTLEDSINIPQNVYGHLGFDENNCVFFKEGTKLFKLNGKKEFELSITPLEERNEETITKFNKVAVEKIGLDLYNGINNIVWFE